MGGSVVGWCSSVEGSSHCLFSITLIRMCFRAVLLVGWTVGWVCGWLVFFSGGQLSLSVFHHSHTYVFQSCFTSWVGGSVVGWCSSVEGSSHCLFSITLIRMCFGAVFRFGWVGG